MDLLETTLMGYQRRVRELEGEVQALKVLLEEERSRAPFCAHGHKLTLENTYIAPKTGFRGCKLCRRTQTLKSQRRRRARLKKAVNQSREL